MYKADNNSLGAVNLVRMASQRDLFDELSQNVEGEEAVGNAELPEEGQEVEENFGGDEANDYDPKTKHTVKFQDAELGILMYHLDLNLDNLVGHIKNNEY